jgi:hypothetical protein
MWKWQSRAIRRHEERLGGFVQCSDSHGQYHLVNFVRDGDRVSMSVPHEFTGGAAALRLRVAEYKLGGPRAGAYQLELFPENHDLEEDFELADDLVPKVISPPGLRLWHLAEFLCTKKTYASIFYPLLAEFQHEYFDALSTGRTWKARWVRVLYFCAFFKSAGLNVTMKLMREAWERFQKKA